MSYTQLAIGGVVFAVVIDLFVARTRLLRRRTFWVAYAILLVFQLLTNGFLTHQQVVRYDPHAVLGGATPTLLGGWRIVYAPVEDIAFGFCLITLTLVSWVWWGRRGLQPTPRPGPPRWRD